MKRIITLLLVLLLSLALFTACGESEAPAPENQGAAPAPEVPGEIFSTGAVQALVPEGWMAFSQSDVFSDDPNALDPNVILICKDAESDVDLMSNPLVRIDYYGPDTEMGGGLKDWYSDPVDLSPMQLGKYNWEGFTTEEYGLMAILYTEDGDYQYQATVYLETDGGTISLEDEDVQAILASVAPADGTATAGGENAAADGSYDWWEGSWYGWWCIKNGTGIYAPATDVAWDAYAEIEIDSSGVGHVRLWDTGTTKDAPLAYGYTSFSEGDSPAGIMTADRVEFFPESVWNNGSYATTMEAGSGAWVVDPANSTVSHFTDMIEIIGHYQDPDYPEDGFDYYIYLRPWGVFWDDVRNGNTEGCIYSDMMPLYHDDWYYSLLNLGYTAPLTSFEEGINVINDYLAGGGTASGGLDPADKAGADGKVDMNTLKAALEWCKAEAGYETPYEEIAAQFGVHGKQIESLFENMSIYRWSASEEAYVQITFSIQEDGSELWNVTQYDGI